MRKQDFIQSKLDDTKFRVYSPGELVTTQEEVDDYAIEFAEWIIDIDNKPVGEFTITELLKIFKKEKGL